MEDKKKHDEAVNKLKAGERSLKTNIIKWKPDYESAAKEFSDAAVCFKACKSYELSKECFVKAADCYRNMNSLFSAAKCIDQAMLSGKEANAYKDIAALSERACSLHQQSGSIEAALASLEKGGKILEANHPQDALGLYQRACDIAISEENIRLAAEYSTKISRLMVKLKLYDQATDAIRREICLYSRTEQNTSVGRLTCALILVQLARGDIIAAEKAFREWGGSCDPPEIQNLELLLRGFDDEDPEAVRTALSHSFFRHMDVEYTRLIKDIEIPVGTGGPKHALVRENAEEPYVSPNAAPNVNDNPRPSTSAMAEFEETGYYPTPTHLRPKLSDSDSSPTDEPDTEAVKSEVEEGEEASLGNDEDDEEGLR